MAKVVIWQPKIQILIVIYSWMGFGGSKGFETPGKWVMGLLTNVWPVCCCGSVLIFLSNRHEKFGSISFSSSDQSERSESSLQFKIKLLAHNLTLYVKKSIVKENIYILLFEFLVIFFRMPSFCRWNSKSNKVLIHLIFWGH